MEALRRSSIAVHGTVKRHGPSATRLDERTSKGDDVALSLIAAATVADQDKPRHGLASIARRPHDDRQGVAWPYDGARPFADATVWFIVVQMDVFLEQMIHQKTQSNHKKI